MIAAAACSTAGPMMSSLTSAKKFPRNSREPRASIAAYTARVL